MDNNADLRFFNAAMKKVQTGTTADEFARNYASASNEKEGSSIWQNYFQKGLKEFSTIDIHKGSEGKIDEEEFNTIKMYVDRLNGKTDGSSTDMASFTGNSLLKTVRTADDGPQEKANPNLSENHNLKPVETMTKEELEAELETYRKEGVISSEEGKPTTKEQESIPPKEQKAPASEDTKVKDKKSELLKRFNLNKPDNDNKSVADTGTHVSSELNALRKNVAAARQKRNEIDRNSDQVDYHIGTFNQGKLGSCAMLSQLNGMSDEQMRKMIQKKTDEQGKTYYEITFPIDSGSNTSVRVTEEELANRKITVEADGESVDISSFSTGDADVTLMEMAYIKRFGIDPVVNGGDLKLVHDVFTYPDEHKQHVGTSYEVTEDKIKQAVQNKEHVTMGLLHVSRLPEDFSYQSSFESSGGVRVEWGFAGKTDRTAALRDLQRMLSNNSGQEVDMSKYEKMSDAELMEATNRYVSADYGFIGCINLSNGYKIIENHAYTLKGYDENTKEVIIANPHNSNEDIRVPIEFATRFFEMSA